MKTIHFLWLTSICLAACAGGQAENASETEPATEVTLTHPVREHIPQKTVLIATTSYQCKRQSLPRYLLLLRRHG